MGYRGKYSVGTQRIVVFGVSGLILTWGLLWVLHVTQYGLCQQELEGAVDSLIAQRTDVANKAEEESREVWRLVQATETAFEEIGRTKAAWASVKVPLIIPCTNEAALKIAPYTLFTLFPLTSKSQVDSCVSRLQRIGASPFVEKLHVVKTPSGAEPAAGDTVFLASGVDEVKAGLSPHVATGFAVVSDTAELSPEAFDILYAAGRQAAGLFGGVKSDLLLLTPCRQPPPSTSVITPLASVPLTPSFSHVFSRAQVTGVPKAFVTTLSGWASVAPSLKTNAEPLQAAGPLFDRCQSSQATAVPVLFSAIDLSYLSRGALYHDWLAHFTRSMSIGTSGHVTAVALDGTRQQVVFTGNDPAG